MVPCLQLNRLLMEKRKYPEEFSTRAREVVVDLSTRGTKQKYDVTFPDSAVFATWLTHKQPATQRKGYRVSCGVSLMIATNPGQSWLFPRHFKRAVHGEGGSSRVWVPRVKLLGPPHILVTLSSTAASF